MVDPQRGEFKGGGKVPPGCPVVRARWDTRTDTPRIGANKVKHHRRD